MIQNRLFTIKEFSKLTGVSADTLRYYDKIGLFSPSEKNSATGYRYYTFKEFEGIGVIQTLQQLGLSLEQIKEFLKNKTFLSSYKLLKNQYSIISKKIEELELLRHYLNEKLGMLDNIIADKMDHEVVIKHLSRRMGFCSKNNCTTYDEIKAESARIVESYNKNLFISNSYAVLIPMQSLLNNSYMEHFYCLIFDIEKDERNTSFAKLVFDEGDYAITRFFGTSFQREDAIIRLLRFIEENNLEITGDAVQLCIIDENLTNLDNEKLNEIQIPVRKRKL